MLRGSSRMKCNRIRNSPKRGEIFNLFALIIQIFRFDFFEFFCRLWCMVLLTGYRVTSNEIQSGRGYEHTGIGSGPIILYMCVERD
jgi:hypothetical protein